VLVAANRRLYGTDCNEAKIKEGLLQVKDCIGKVLRKIKVVQMFTNEN
jgi:hypothetical protein